MDADKHRWTMEATISQDPLTERIIGCALSVSNALGIGFLEKVYENPLKLKSSGLQVTQQTPLHVWYRDEIVGDYIADLIVNDAVTTLKPPVSIPASS